jgi:hypothetical protein
MADGQTTPRLFTCHHCGANFSGRKRKYCSALCKQQEKTKRDGFVPSGRKRLQPTPIVDGKRQCLKCGQIKAIDQFVKTRLSRSGRQSTCMECEKRRANKWAKTRTKETRQKERALIAARQGRTYAPGRRTLPFEVLQSRLIKKNARQAWDYWMQTLAPDDWMKSYWDALGEPWRNPRLTDAERYRVRYSIDPSFAIKERIRRQVTKAAKRDGVGELLRGALRRGGQSPMAEKLLGYGIDDLRLHLERQFTKGMNWDRFMAGEIHIDHIIPQSHFDMRDEGQWRKCWCLSNLQPLWAKHNLEKRDRVLYLL